MADCGTEAAEYEGWARAYVAYFLVNAITADGSHYRRQYNSPDTTFSLKYNTLYHYFLGLDLVPNSVMQTEIAFYTGPQAMAYGTPLDDRNTFTLFEYMAALVGVASRAGGPPGSQHTMTDALWRFANTTQQRVPMTDWYSASTAAQVGFQARSTVGDIYALLLLNKK